MNDYICTKHKVNYDMSINVCNACYSEMKQRIKKLEAENKRLKDALEKIKDYKSNPFIDIIEVKEIAQKALEGK